MTSPLVPTQFPGYDNESEDDNVVLQFRAYELGQSAERLGVHMVMVAQRWDFLYF